MCHALTVALTSSDFLRSARLGSTAAVGVAAADFLAEGAVTSGTLVREGKALPLLDMTLSASSKGMNLHLKLPICQAIRY